MLEFLGLVFGGLLRLAPTLFSFLEKSREGELELRRMQLEAELEAQRGAARLAEIAAVAKAHLQVEQVKQEGAVNVADIQAISDALRSQMRPTGDKWLDRVNVSVRPVLTYWWCVVLHTGHKIAVLTYGVIHDTKFEQLMQTLYTDFDRGVVGSIIGFWFVDRTLRGMNK